MTETLQEFVDCRGAALRVDRAAGVIRGVKILGLTSRNGRLYLPEALAGAAALYEGAKVNVNHPQGSPLAPRDYRDRIGVVRRVAVRPDEGLFADFHFNPKHALAEQLAWDAEHAPENVGFSHNVQARTARRGDQVVVEAITRVESVDLVADPATTRGLFEGAGEKTPWLAEVTADQIREHRPELAAALAEGPLRRIAELEAEVARLRAAESEARKRLLVRRLLAEHCLPDPDAADASARSVVSQRFLETLLAAPDEAAIRALIDDRARLVRGAVRPQSREQQAAAGAVQDVKSFVKAIT